MPITEVLLPLANAAFAALALYSVLQDSHHHDFLPWVAVLFGAFYLGLMRLPKARVASAVHLSLAVVFLTIAIFFTWSQFRLMNIVRPENRGPLMNERVKTTAFTMAALYSHGATQLLCGEADRILVDPYYVRNHVIEPSTAALLKRWYDFLVGFVILHGKFMAHGGPRHYVAPK